MQPDRPPHHLDIGLFTQSQRAIGGRDWLSSYPRLMAEAPGMDCATALNWQASGQLRSDGAAGRQDWLHLTVDTRLSLICQRCLTSVEVAVKVDQQFRFVDSEQSAQEQDEICEEQVLAMNHDLDLADLIEDEVMLALPLIPRHEVCPVAVKMTVADPGFAESPTGAPRPFAALAKLRKPPAA